MMGATKKHIYTETQIALADLFKALGHPARISIIENLLIHDDLNCKSLGNYIQLAQPTISAHIKVLHDVGILAVSVIDNNAYYQVYKVPLEHMETYIDQIVQKMEIKPQNKQSLYVKTGQGFVAPTLINSV